MKQSNYEVKTSTPYFYYPKDGDRYYLISYEEVNKIKDREGGGLLFADLRMSFSEQEAKENYEKVEKFIVGSMTSEEKEEFSNYPKIKEERVLESSIEDKYWVSAMLDVWSLNCDKSNFEIKVGHKVDDEYSVLMYRKKRGVVKENMIKFFGKKKYGEVRINMKNIDLNEGYSFSCGDYSYSIGDDHLEMRKRGSKFTPLVILLETGYTYGKKGEKELTEMSTD
jgi:hypothetical protein